MILRQRASRRIKSVECSIAIMKRTTTRPSRGNAGSRTCAIPVFVDGSGRSSKRQLQNADRSSADQSVHAVPFDAWRSARRLPIPAPRRSQWKDAVNRTEAGRALECVRIECKGLGSRGATRETASA